MRWRFTSSAQGWSTGGFTFTGGFGSPARGCLAGAGSIDTTRSGLSISVLAGESWSFRCRFVGNGGFSVPQNVSVEFEIFNGTSWFLLYSDVVFEFTSPTDDSGWMTISGTLPYTDTITQLHIIFLGLAEATGYLDTVAIAEAGLDYDFSHNTGGVPGSII